MILKHPEDVPSKEVVMEGASKVRMQGLIMKEDGAPGFAMRLFEVAPGGNTPLHRHPHEHEVYIVEGRAEMTTEEGAVSLQSGDAILVYPGALHNFKNTGESPLRFLCFVPNKR